MRGAGFSLLVAGVTLVGTSHDLRLRPGWTCWDLQINLRDSIGVRVFSHSHDVDCSSCLVLKAVESLLVLNHVEFCEIEMELTVPLHVVSGVLVAIMLNRFVRYRRVNRRPRG